MGKGLSPLQKDILAALEEFASLEERAGGSLRSWARPHQLLERLRRAPTASNRVALSKALDRLHDRGLIAKAMSEALNQGKSWFYARITDPKNAGYCSVPDVVCRLDKRKPKMKTVARADDHFKAK